MPQSMGIVLCNYNRPVCTYLLVLMCENSHTLYITSTCEIWTTNTQLSRVNKHIYTI